MEDIQQQQQTMEVVEEAILEAVEYPPDVFILPLKKRVPTSALDNVEIVKVEGTNRRRLIGTYAEQGADGETKVHKVSVYIKSAKPDGEEEEKPRKPRVKPSEGSAIKKAAKKSKRALSAKQIEAVLEFVEKFKKASAKEASA